jgi:hypothetical protein
MPQPRHATARIARRLPLQPLAGLFPRSGGATEDSQVLLGLRGGVIQRLGMKHARADILALQLGPDRCPVSLKTEV